MQLEVIISVWLVRVLIGDLTTISYVTVLVMVVTLVVLTVEVSYLVKYLFRVSRRGY